jgi:4-amino-4-deoxy-L-arabinose transferase-like glycosyltransferase
VKHALLLFLFGALLWGGEYLRRDLWSPDEARFAFVAGEMRRDGHWAVPHKHSAFYAHKPPLLFWLQRGFAQLTGGEIGRVSARLPSFLGALLTFWVTGLFAARWLGPAVRWKAILILGTSLVFWREGSMGRMDALLCGLELTALYLLLANHDQPAHWRPLVAYACLGLGILTKGPVGLLVPLAAYVTIVCADRGPRSLAQPHLAWGPLLALLFPAAWFLAAWIEQAPSAYFHELLFKQNIGRITGEGGFGKPQPFYYYILQLPVDFMPWTIFVPAAIASFRIAPAFRASRRRLMAWVLAIVVFFSLSTGKRSLYILAAYPALSLLLAGCWDSFPRLPAGWQRATAATGFLALLLVGTVSLAGSFIQPMPIPAASLVPGCVLAFAGAGACWYTLARRGFGTAWFRCFASAVFLILAAEGALALPALNPIKTPRSAAAAIQREVSRSEKLVIFGEGMEIVPLYCNRTSINATDIPDLQQAMKLTGKGALVCTQEAWDEYLQEAIRNVKPPHKFSVGRQRLVWAAFDLREEVKQSHD